MKFYLGSRFIRQSEIRGYAQFLRDLGHKVECRWLEEGHDMMPDDSDEVAQKLAMDDWEDLNRADRVVIFVGARAGGRARGGYHVEFGMAIGIDTPVTIVGQRENVFHWLPWVEHFETVEAWKAAVMTWTPFESAPH